MIYQWKPGSRFRLDPQTAGEHLQELHERHGGLTARVVVNDAQRKRSPLHDAFDWDDATAADEWRLHTARKLVAAVVVQTDAATDHPPHRAYVIVNEVGEDHYTTVARAMSDAQLREQVMGRALRELGQWRDRYHELEELRDVFVAMDQVAAGGRQRV